jgi:hypothetical protein
MSEIKKNLMFLQSPLRYHRNIIAEFKQHNCDKFQPIISLVQVNPKIANCYT